MAYSDSFPAQRASFMADFANGGRIDPRMTFTRASSANVWDGSKHLSSENLLTDSNGFPAYSTSGVATPSVSGTFLDGTDAFVVTETATNNSHFIYSPLHQFENGKQYTATVFVKAGTASSIQLLFNNNVFSSTVYANYDLATPTNAPVAGADATATSTGLSDGWVKITLTGTATSSALYALLYVVFNNDDINSARAPIYTPASAKNFYIWNAQVSTTGETVLNETSGQIHRAYAPTLQTAAINAPRFEYSPTDSASAAMGESLGLLVEGQTANLNTYSEDFSDSGYTKVNSSIQINSAIAPDGSLTADLLAEDGATGAHAITKSVNTGLSVGSTKYAISIFAKAAGRTLLQIFDNGQGTTGDTTFNLSNGTVLAGGGYIEACGNGWYRCTIIPTADSSAISQPNIRLNNGSGTSYVGDSYSGVLLWGLQLETGNGSGTSHSSSYIGTTTSSATRALDSASVVTADIGYTGGPVTLVADTTTSATDNYRQALSILTNSQNQVTLYGNSINNRLGYVQSGSQSSTLTQTSANGISALSFGVNDIAATRNGAAPVTDTSQALPDVSGGTLKIGGSGTNQILNGHVKRVAIYNEALSDTNLQALTS